MSLQDSLLKTIAYFDLFDTPLTAEEIQKYLYGFDRPVHIKEIKGELGLMAERVGTLKDYYFLKGREEIVKVRETRKNRSRQYWDKTKFYGLHMRRVPFVRMIAVCNTLSFNNVTDESDIDLLIVTEPGRLWTARLFLTLLLQFFGVRRHGNKVAGRFCLSFFVTKRRLDFKPLELLPEDPYLAYWMAFLTPIEGRETYEEFKRLNAPWLKEKYGLSFVADPEVHLYHLPPSRLKRAFEWMMKGHCGNLIEKILKFFLEKRAKRKAMSLDPKTSGVAIEEDLLKFHDRDRRRDYYSAWLKRLAETPPPASPHN